MIGWLQKSFLSIAGLFVSNKNFKCVDTVYCHSWGSWDPDEVGSCCCGLVKSDDVKRAGGSWCEANLLSIDDLVFSHPGKFLSHPIIPNAVNENTTIDVFISKSNAIKIALETCVNMLNIGLVLHL